MKINLNINKVEREDLTNLLVHATANSRVRSLVAKIEAACVRAEQPKLPSRVTTLKTMTWYLAEVAFTSNNPIHRCIAFHQSGGNLELHGSYDGIEDRNISTLAYFRPIRELPEMKEVPVSVLSKDAPQVIYIQNL